MSKKKGKEGYKLYIAESFMIVEANKMNRERYKGNMGESWRGRWTNN